MSLITVKIYHDEWLKEEAASTGFVDLSATAMVGQILTNPWRYDNPMPGYTNCRWVGIILFKDGSRALIPNEDLKRVLIALGHRDLSEIKE